MPQNTNIQKSIDFINQLETLISGIPSIEREEASRHTKSLKNIRQKIGSVIERLSDFSKDTDHVAHPSFTFDPSDPEVTGILIALVLIEQPRRPLIELSKFYGSGVYALYYKGDFPAYAPIRGTDNPIYVGKADPQIMEARNPIEQGLKLWERLKKHSNSIRAASKIKSPSRLSVEDFDYRYLVVRSAWQVTAEAYLIHLYKPIWNLEMGICYGFGKHGDSPITRGNTRSPWDTLHMGRKWATQEGNVTNPKTPEMIMAEIAEHYRKYPPLQKPRESTLTDILKSFSRRIVTEEEIAEESVDHIE